MAVVPEVGGGPVGWELRVFGARAGVLVRQEVVEIHRV